MPSAGVGGRGKAIVQSEEPLLILKEQQPTDDKDSVPLSAFTPFFTFVVRQP